MATTNGIYVTNGMDTPQPQLGKRKRSASLESLDDGTHTQGSGAELTGIEAALAIISKHKSGDELLDHQLTSSRVKESQATKRRRTQSASQVSETIRTRIANKAYQTLNQLMDDIDEVRKLHSSQTNGHTDSKSLQVVDIEEISRSIQSQTTKHASTNTIDKEDTVGHFKSQNPQLLSLRGQTDAGVRQLFTGLPLTQPEQSTDTDTKRLPNGFELIDSALLSVANDKRKDSRTFGSVFTSNKSLKPLDPPRQFRTNTTQLDFIPELSKLGSANRLDYRTTPLSTGNWLSYATSASNQPGTEFSKPSDPADIATSLFKAAYSSFAPTADHSPSVVTESDRARRWYTMRRRRVLLEEPMPGPTEKQQRQNGEADTNDNLSLELADDLDEVVENYVSEADFDNRNDSEQVLEEVSELIRNLSSYQTIRDLEHARGPSSTSKPSQSEIDIYEMLRNQLRLLVDSLPPHAVAKLNGDQMDYLNIKPNIAITTQEKSGTGQADDYTIRKQRTAHAATNTISRGSAGVPTRPGYGTPNPAYSSHNQTYGHGNAANAAYNARAANNAYNTPRPGIPNQNAQYSQQPYRASNTAYTTPVAQPYQHVGNKYNPNFVSRASQPGYQQRAQDRGSAWQRPESPHKPLINGQMAQQYQNRQFAGQGHESTNSPVQSNSLVQQRLLEQSKLQNPATVSQGTLDGTTV